MELSVDGWAVEFDDNRFLTALVYVCLRVYSSGKWQPIKRGIILHPGQKFYVSRSWLTDCCE